MSYRFDNSGAYWVGFGQPAIAGKGETPHTITTTFRAWNLAGTASTEAEVCSLLVSNQDTVWESGNGESIAINSSGQLIARIAVNGTSSFITGPTLTTGVVYFAALVRGGSGVYSLYYGTDSARVTLVGTTTVVDVSARPGNLAFIAAQTWNASGFDVETEYLAFWGGALSVSALNTLRSSSDALPQEARDYANFPMRLNFWQDLAAIGGGPHNVSVSGGYYIGYPLQRVQSRARHKRLTLPSYAKTIAVIATSCSTLTDAVANVGPVYAVASIANTTTSAPAASVTAGFNATANTTTTAPAASIGARASIVSTANTTTTAPAASIGARASIVSTANTTTTTTAAVVNSSASVAGTANTTTTAPAAAVSASATLASTATTTTTAPAAVGAAAGVASTANTTTGATINIVSEGDGVVQCVSNTTTSCASVVLARTYPLISTANTTTTAPTAVGAAASVSATSNTTTTAPAAAVNAGAAVTSTANTTTTAPAAAVSASATLTSTANTTTTAPVTLTAARQIAATADTTTNASASVGVLVVANISAGYAFACDTRTSCPDASLLVHQDPAAPRTKRMWPPRYRY